MGETFQIPPRRYSVIRFAENRVKCHGVDKGGYGVVVAENDKVMVVKWPSGKHWAGRGMPPAYHAPSTDVLTKDLDGRFTLLISWQNRRTREDVKPGSP